MTTWTMAPDGDGVTTLWRYRQWDDQHPQAVAYAYDCPAEIWTLGRLLAGAPDVIEALAHRLRSRCHDDLPAARRLAEDVQRALHDLAAGAREPHRAEYEGLPQIPPAQPAIPQGIRDRVARGAAWLDEHEPGWVDQIDLDRLDLLSGCGCILGQLDTAASPDSSGYWDAVAHHELTDDETTALGFNASWLDDLVTNRADYPRLTEAWRQLITARRAEVAGDA